MFKFKTVIISVSIVLLSILVWRTTMLFGSLADWILTDDTGTQVKTDFESDSKSASKANQHEGHYETIQETIERLKRDVVVTGTITGAPGLESAMFRIEGMADRQFMINKQLMDGFIIREITKMNVVLVNQAGHERINFEVQGQSRTEKTPVADTSDTNQNDMVETQPANTWPSDSYNQRDNVDQFREDNNYNSQEQQTNSNVYSSNNIFLEENSSQIEALTNKKLSLLWK